MRAAKPQTMTFARLATPRDLEQQAIDMPAGSVKFIQPPTNQSLVLEPGSWVEKAIKNKRYPFAPLKTTSSISMSWKLTSRITDRC